MYQSTKKSRAAGGGGLRRGDLDRRRPPRRSPADSRAPDRRTTIDPPIVPMLRTVALAIWAAAWRTTAAVPRAAAHSAVSRWRVKAPMRTVPSSQFADAAQFVDRGRGSRARAVRSRARSSSPPASHRRRSAWPPDRLRSSAVASSTVLRPEHALQRHGSVPASGSPRDPRPQRRDAARSRMRRRAACRAFDSRAIRRARAARATAGAATVGYDRAAAKFDPTAPPSSLGPPRYGRLAASRACRFAANSSPTLCAFFFITPSAKRPSRPVMATSER